MHGSLQPCAREEGRDGPPTSPQWTRVSPAGVSPSMLGGVQEKQGDRAAPTAEEELSEGTLVLWRRGALENI